MVEQQHHGHDSVSEADKSATRVEDIRYYDIPALILFAALALIVILQFMTRYVLNDSLAWTEEIARFLLLGVTFFGAISLVARGEHIAVELIFRKARPSNAKPLAISVAAIGTVYYLVLAMAALALASQTEQMLISVKFPKAVVYFLLAGAIALCGVFSLVRLITLFKKTNDDVAAIYRDDARQSELAND